MELNRQPAYQQLNDALRQLVADGAFQAGAKFLTEREIAERFGVSRATANKALSNLVSERVLEFKPGIGTFIHGRVLDYSLKKLVSFTDRARAAGKQPATRVLRFEKLRAAELPADAAQALKLPAGEAAYFVERLRLADDVPVILERRYLAERYAPAVTRADLAGSLYAYWRDVLGLAITGAEQVIRAVTASAADAEHLGVPRGSANLLVIATGFTEAHRPLWFEHTQYRADAYEFHITLGALAAPYPATGRFASAHAE